MIDIVNDLRFIALIHEGRHRHECIRAAADLIEELESLITEWANAYDEWNGSENYPSPRFHTSVNALRKAVGR